MFHTAGMCFLTVVINGTSMRYLIRFLGMDKMAPAKARMFSQALRKIAHAGTKREQKAMREGVFATVVWEVARGYYVREEDMLHETRNTILFRNQSKRPRPLGDEGGSGKDVTFAVSV